MIPLLVASAVAGFVALALTPFLIRVLKREGFGQEIREDGPEMHLVKRGTPTMGGVVILFAVYCGYAVSHIPQLDANRKVTVNALLVIGVASAMGLLGFLDDFLKIRNQRSLGLNKTAKFGGQIVIALVFALLAHQYTGASTEISFVRPIGFALPTAVFVIWVLILFSATSNAVNLTDGLDGLAAGSSSMVFGAFIVIAFWQFRHPAFYGVDQALDLAVIAAAFAGGCAGFLWWNTAPAKIFMGDTGSLALGGALAALAFLTNTQLLLVIIGGLFVIETLSVILQVGSFRIFGRRVFRMAPIHHHFELSGWPEITVIVRFWMISAFCVTIGVGIFYADWLQNGFVL